MSRAKTNFLIKYGPVHHAETALNSKRPEDRMIGVQSLNATEDHLDKALSDSDGYVRLRAAENPNMTEKNVHKALNDEIANVGLYAVRHSKNLSSKALHTLLDHPDPDVREMAIRREDAKDEHYEHAIKYHDRGVRRAVADYTKNHKHIDTLINDENAFVRKGVAANHSISPEHIDKLLNDSSHHVRMDAVLNPVATEEHLRKALKDKDVHVRMEASKMMRKRFGTSI